MRTGCPKEATQQSEYSPGRVECVEPIVFVLVDPLTATEGSIREISNSKLKSGNLSVCRALHCTASEVHDHVVHPLLAVEGRTYVGMVWAKCEDIRAIRLGDSDEYAFCINDDGLSNYKAHALLAFAIPKNDKLRNERVAARGNLKDLLLKDGIKEAEGCPFRV